MWKIIWTYFRLGIINELGYRTNFFVQLGQSAIDLASALAGLAVVFSHTDTLGGWRQTELLALLGVYFIVGGLIRLLIQPSMQRLMEQVRLGTLDFTLTKPADSQLLISVQQVQIWKLADIGLGLVTIGIALARLGETTSLWNALAFGLALLAGGAIVYSFWLLLATCSFWFVRVENILVIFQSMYEAGRWPVGIYPPWLRWSLTFLVPVAFATTVPAEALSGRLTVQTLLGAIALAAALLLISRAFWRVGLRRYAGASA
ncbi:MAG TPA: ABC-2 family transporter protein [Thermomicrobiales bacterium]|nr:ABC-2 family transporter protein [Thermomicrobiales bacterium]